MNDSILDFLKSTKEENRHLITTKNEIIDYGFNALFTKDQYEAILIHLEDGIPDLIYIVLSVDIRNIPPQYYQ